MIGENVIYFITFILISVHHINGQFDHDIITLVKYAENKLNNKEISEDDIYFSKKKSENDFSVISDIQPDFSSTLHPTVSTTSGEVEGITFSESHAFYGIPYAEAPEGSLRFKSPVPIQTRRKINGTINSGLYCSQSTSRCESEEACTINMKEDCLILNVFVPLLIDFSGEVTGQLDVMFYVHGGSFLHGRSTSTTHDGRWLANESENIIVTINYRLGPWGFLAFDDGSNVISGKQGMEDQTLALKWVNENIANFGGNPNSVTIFGNSAGAQACMLHLLDDDSNPYFHRVIMQSNPAVFPYPSSEEAYVITNKMTSYLNCSEGDEYNCLISASQYDINAQEFRIQASSLFAGDVWNMVEPFRPVVGFTDPLGMFRDGIWQTDKQIIVGTNTGECDAAQEILKFLPKSVSYRVYQIVNNIFMGSDSLGSTVTDQYVEWYAQDTGFARAISEQMTHAFFICPSRALARFASDTAAQRRNIYYYSFAHPREGEVCEGINLDPNCGYCTHASEVKFVFRSGPYVNYPFSDDDYSAADQFSFYWDQFSQSGDPSTNTSPDFYDWKAYEEGSGAEWMNVVIDAPKSSEDVNYLEEVCDFWDSLNFYVDMPNAPNEPTTTTTTTTEEVKTDAPIIDDVKTTTDASSAKRMSVILMLISTLLCYLYI